MRNAVAHFDDDYASDEPARKPRPARKSSGSVKKKSTRRKQGGRRSYLHYAAIGLSATLVVGIMVNALVLQHSRHPAPLFGRAIQLGGGPAAAPPPAAATPVPVPPVEAATPPAPLQPPAPLHVTPAVPSPIARGHHADAATAAKPRQDDPIAKLLQASTGSATDKAQEKSPSRESAKTVLSLQHALMKLGFVVKPNGSFGPATRSALEAFERDQHLPVKGEMSRKVLKQLSAESGIAIE